VKRSHENASEKVLCVAAGVAVDLALAGWLAQAFIAAPLLEMLRSPAAAAAAACLHCIRLLLLAGWLACVWRSGWRAGWPVCGALILEMLLAGVTRSALASVSACQRLLALLLPQQTFACER